MIDIRWAWLLALEHLQYPPLHLLHLGNQGEVYPARHIAPILFSLPTFRG